MKIEELNEKKFLFNQVNWKWNDAFQNWKWNEQFYIIFEIFKHLIWIKALASAKQKNREKAIIVFQHKGIQSFQLL